MVVSDNSSNDETWQILTSMRSGYSGRAELRLLRASGSLDAVSHWREALNACSGQWVKVVWDDDWIEDNCVSKMLGAGVELSADVVTCAARIHHPHGRIDLAYDSRPQVSSLGECLEAAAGVGHPVPVSPTAALLRSETARQGLKHSNRLGNCRDAAIGPDFLMLYAGQKQPAPVVHLNLPLVNMWAGADSISMNAQYHRLRSCYDASIVLAAQVTDTSLSPRAVRAIRHRAAMYRLLRRREVAATLPPQVDWRRFLMNLWNRRTRITSVLVVASNRFAGKMGSNVGR